MKDIVIKVSDGVVVEVYVPDPDCNVHIVEDDPSSNDELVMQYYQDVDKVCEELYEVIGGWEN